MTFGRSLPAVQEVDRVNMDQALSLGPGQRCRSVRFPGALVLGTPQRADLSLESLPGAQETVSRGRFWVHAGHSSFRLICASGDRLELVRSPAIVTPRQIECIGQRGALGRLREHEESDLKPCFEGFARPCA